MNPLPTASFWAQSFAGLALETALLLVAAALVQTALTSPRWRRAVWLAALAGLALLLVNAVTGFDREVAAWFAPDPGPQRHVIVRHDLSRAPAPAGLAADDAALRAAEADPAAATPVSPAAPSAVWWPAWLWILGVAGFGVRAMLPRLWLALVLRRHPMAVSAEATARLAALQRRLDLSHPVSLFASPRLAGPIAFGVRQRAIGLPPEFWTAHSVAEQDAMLAHELAHLAARDPLWLALADLLAALLWWHPLVWWARRQFRAASELAADEASLVVEDGPAVLAGCLVALASRWRQRGWLGLLGMAGFRSGLGRRVERLLRLSPLTRGRDPRGWGRWLTAAAGALVVTLSLLASAWLLPVRAGTQPTLLAMMGGALALNARADGEASPAAPTSGTASAPSPAPTLAAPATTVPAGASASQVAIWVGAATGFKSEAERTLVRQQLIQRFQSLDRFARVDGSFAAGNVLVLGATLREGDRLEPTWLAPDGLLERVVRRRGVLEFRSVHPESDTLVAKGETPEGYEALSQELAGGATRRILVGRGPVADLTSTNVTEATVKSEAPGEFARIGVAFDAAGTRSLAAFTRTNVGQLIAVVLDGQLVMAPRVNEAIAGGRCEITGPFSETEARALSAAVRHPLPLSLQVLTTTFTGEQADAQAGKNSAATGTLIRDGKLLFELGRLADARAKLEEALKLTPANAEAAYYLGLVREAEARPASTASGPSNSGKAESPGRAIIRRRLDQTVIEQVTFAAPGTPLTEVIRFLADAARSRDPDHVGVNFVLSPDGRDRGPAGARPLGETLIPIDPPLSQIRLADLLDVVVKVADQRLQYTIEDYGVVWARPAGDPNALFTRSYKVNPELIAQNLAAASGGGATNGLPPGEALLRWLRAAGLDFGKTNGLNSTNLTASAGPAGKSMFFNDRNGILLVRATLTELDLVEQLLQTINTAPPQVTIEAKFVEITQSDEGGGLGFDWFLGQTQMSNSPAGGVLSAGIRPGTNGAATATGLRGDTQFQLGTNGPVTVTALMNDPQFRSVVGALAKSATNGARELRGDQLDWPGRQTTNAANIRVTTTPAGAPLTGILTDPQFRVVLRGIEQRTGVDMLAAPRVTTLSGRSAQVQVVELHTILTGLNPAATPSGSTPPGTNVSAYTTAQLPVGPTLDLTPVVRPDGHTIELNVMPTVTEFLGYDEPPKDSKVRVWEQGKTRLVDVPLPRFRVRQMQTRAVIEDGQTLVLGGLPIEETVRTQDKVPVLGDIPLAGRLFRSESKQTVRKRLLVFVTATIIDPAGNPVHAAAKATPPAPGAGFFPAPPQP